MPLTIKRNDIGVEAGKIAYDLLNEDVLIATLKFPDTIDTEEVETDLESLIASLDAMNTLCLENNLEPVDYTKITGVWNPEEE